MYVVIEYLYQPSHDDHDKLEVSRVYGPFDSEGAADVFVDEKRVIAWPLERFEVIELSSVT